MLPLAKLTFQPDESSTESPRAALGPAAPPAPPVSFGAPEISESDPNTNHPFNNNKATSAAPASNNMPWLMPPTVPDAFTPGWPSV